MPSVFEGGMRHHHQQPRREVDKSRNARVLRVDDMPNYLQPIVIKISKH